MFIGINSTLVKFNFFPIFFHMALLTVLSITIWLAALSIDLRDIKHAIPFLAQIWMFITPIVYPITVIPER